MLEYTIAILHYCNMINDIIISIIGKRDEQSKDETDKDKYRNKTEGKQVRHLARAFSYSIRIYIYSHLLHICHNEIRLRHISRINKEKSIRYNC